MMCQKLGKCCNMFLYIYDVQFKIIFSNKEKNTRQNKPLQLHKLAIANLLTK